jgi:hypothetical protein
MYYNFFKDVNLLSLISRDKNDKKKKYRVFRGYWRFFANLTLLIRDNELLFPKKCSKILSKQFFRRHQVVISNHFCSKRLDKTRVFRGFRLIRCFLIDNRLVFSETDKSYKIVIFSKVVGWVIYYNLLEVTKVVSREKPRKIAKTRNFILIIFSVTDKR